MLRRAEKEKVVCTLETNHCYIGPEAAVANRVEAASPSMLSAAQLLLGAAQLAPPHLGLAPPQGLAPPSGLAPAASRTGGLQ